MGNAFAELSSLVGEVSKRSNQIVLAAITQKTALMDQMSSGQVSFNLSGTNK